MDDVVDIERTDWIAEDVAADVLGVLRGNFPTRRADMVAEIVAELVDNFAQHSGTTLAALTMQYYPRRHDVIIAIGDRGSEFAKRPNLTSSEGTYRD